MAKRRVLSICYIYPDKLGSFEEFIISLSERLKEKGFCHVITFPGKPIKEVYNRLLDAGADIEIINPSLSYLRDAFLFYKLVKKYNPSVVHFHFYEPYTIFNYLALFRNIKIIYTEHMGHKETKNKLKRVLKKVYFPLRAKMFDFGVSRIICISEFVKSNFIRKYRVNSKKLVVIYNGINTNRYKKIDIEGDKIIDEFDVKPDDVIVLCVAALIKEKGVQYLIEAASIITERVPNVKFFIVGDGPYRKNLEALIKKYNLTDFFLLTGRVRDIEIFYSISSCVVVPSIWEEAFCFVAAEAMSTEVPVVAFDSGGLREVMADGETGYLVPKKDHLALAEKIIEIIKNRDTSKMMGRKGKERVIEKFSLEKCVDSYVRVYEEVLNIK